MTIYYTEYPTGQFKAKSDADALRLSTAKVIYKESDDGKSMIILREPFENQITNRV